MMEAEKIGRNRQCKFVTLNTMDGKGQPFYQKLGYEIEFVQNGYSNDSRCTC